MTTKYRFESADLADKWLEVFVNKRPLNATKSPEWEIYLQPSLFVTNAVGLIFKSRENQWFVIATTADGRQIEEALRSQTAEDVLSSIQGNE